MKDKGTVWKVYQVSKPVALISFNIDIQNKCLGDTEQLKERTKMKKKKLNRNIN